MSVPLNKIAQNGSTFVVPAQAGTQEIQLRLDTRLRGCDG
jgi:hypothetical protein